MYSVILPNGTKIKTSSIEDVVKIDSLLCPKNGAHSPCLHKVKKSSRKRSGAKPSSTKTSSMSNTRVAKFRAKGNSLVYRFIKAMTPYVVKATGLVRKSAINRFCDDFQYTTLSGSRHQFKTSSRMVEKYVPKALRAELTRTVEQYYHGVGLKECCRRIDQFVSKMNKD